MKKAFVFILKTIGVLLGIVVLYIVLGLLLPLIKVPAEETSDPKTIPMYIYTNGSKLNVTLIDRIRSKPDFKVVHNHIKKRYLDYDIEN